MSDERSGHIREINGPILRIHLPGGRNGEQVRIGSLDIVGEVIALEGEDAIVQAYESTDGLRPAAMVRWRIMAGWSIPRAAPRDQSVKICLLL